MKKLLLVCFGLFMLGCDSEPVYDGRPFSYWRQELKCKDATGRMRAAAVMNVLGQRARPAMPDLIECLGDSNYVVRYEAALALGRLGPFAEPAVPALTKLLSDRNHRVREAAAKALEQIEPGKEHGRQSNSSGAES
jgi:HEAT repeats